MGGSSLFVCHFSMQYKGILTYFPISNLIYSMNSSDKEYLSSLEKEVIGDHVYFFRPSDKDRLSSFKKKIETLEELEKFKKWYQKIVDSRELSEAKRIYKQEIDSIVKNIRKLQEERWKESRNRKSGNRDRHDLMLGNRGGGGGIEEIGTGTI